MGVVAPAVFDFASWIEELELGPKVGRRDHWSLTHTQWWSAVRYCVYTTPQRPEGDDARIPWSLPDVPFDPSEDAQDFTRRTRGRGGARKKLPKQLAARTRKKRSLPKQFQTHVRTETHTQHTFVLYSGHDI